MWGRSLLVAVCFSSRAAGYGGQSRAEQEYGCRFRYRRHVRHDTIDQRNQVIVVLNKMDLVKFGEESFNEVKNKIDEFLNSINMRPVSYIPICAIKGDNIARKSPKMNWYSGLTFLETLDVLENRESSENKPLIFPVQDVYEIGDKRIVVGRIEAGVLEKGCRIKILPGGKVTGVNTIEKYLEKEDKACAGESIGITIEDPDSLSRGDVICSPGKEPILSDTFSASIFWMAREDFKKGGKLTLRCATQERTCKVVKIKRRINSSTLEIIQEDAKILKNLEIGEAIIKTKRPLAIRSFGEMQELGRFVLVQDETICAGGIITGV